MDSAAGSATASEDPKTKDWQEEVKAAGSLPGSSKNVRHKSHAFGDPEKLRYSTLCLSGLEN